VAKTSHILENALYASEHEIHALKIPLEGKDKCRRSRGRMDGLPLNASVSLGNCLPIRISFKLVKNDSKKKVQITLWTVFLYQLPCPTMYQHPQADENHILGNFRVFVYTALQIYDHYKQ